MPTRRPPSSHAGGNGSGTGSGRYSSSGSNVVEATRSPPNTRALPATLPTPATFPIISAPSTSPTLSVTPTAFSHPSTKPTIIPHTSNLFRSGPNYNHVGAQHAAPHVRTISRAAEILRPLSLKQSPHASEQFQPINRISHTTKVESPRTQAQNLSTKQRPQNANLPPRHPLLPAHAAQVLRLHLHRHPHPRSRHRRQHRHLLPRQRLPLPPPPRQRRRPPRGHRCSKLPHI